MDIDQATQLLRDAAARFRDVALHAGSAMDNEAAVRTARAIDELADLLDGGAVLTGLRPESPELDAIIALRNLAERLAPGTALPAWQLLREAMTQVRVCACGCGEMVESSRPEAKYATSACRVRAHRQRRLCAHADGKGMHWLEPGEKCPLGKGTFVR
jgi:hypothetical protein